MKRCLPTALCDPRHPASALPLRRLLRAPRRRWTAGRWSAGGQVRSLRRLPLFSGFPPPPPPRGRFWALDGAGTDEMPASPGAGGGLASASRLRAALLGLAAALGRACSLEEFVLSVVVARASASRAVHGSALRLGPALRPYSGAPPCRLALGWQVLGAGGICGVPTAGLDRRSGARRLGSVLAGSLSGVAAGGRSFLTSGARSRSDSFRVHVSLLGCGSGARDAGAGDGSGGGVQCPGGGGGGADR